jgi:hypothetical protein
VRTFSVPKCSGEGWEKEAGCRHCSPHLIFEMEGLRIELARKASDMFFILTEVWPK